MKHRNNQYGGLLIALFILLFTACQSTIGEQSTPQIILLETLTPTVEINKAVQPPTEQLPTNQSHTAIPATATVLPPSFPDPVGYTWQVVVNGLNRPLGMAAPADDSGRIYILEQAGMIRILQDGQLLEQPFLNLQNQVGTNANEQGLLGIALDPNYINNRFFYLNYSDLSGNTVISRFQANEDLQSADVESEQILLQVKQPYANHNGGSLAFGPDGFLYLGLGDGGSGGDPEQRAQNPDTLLGKLLRISVSEQDGYAIPADNPFAQGGGRMEVWALGLRNPWRFSFDRQTGDLWIADVGQGEWEEIDFLPASSSPGANFGWDYREGSHPFERQPAQGVVLIDPVFEYGHDQGCSVTGGMVYHGKALPEWHGVYVFGDYCTGRVWGLIPDGAGVWQSRVLFESGVNISSFGEDAQGELYIIAHTGSVLRLEPR
jgi:glucose/arabinose dehydrogenase